MASQQDQKGYPQPGYSQPGQPTPGYGQPQALPPGYQPPQAPPTYVKPQPAVITVRTNPNAGPPGNSFAEDAVRQGFINKVFSLLAVMLLVTSGIISLFIFVDSVAVYCQENVWPLPTALVVYLVTAFTLTMPCCGDIRRKHPTNLIILSIFTVATGVMLGVVCSMFTVDSVALAGGITTLTCLAVSLFAIVTKIDFTKCSGILLALLFALIIAGIFCAIPFRTPVLYRVYAGIGAVIFVFILIMDIQMIVGGGRKFKISPEEYVFAALQVYLDVVNIFLRVLSIVGNRK